MEGYCVKCKTKREMKNTEQVTMKNGRPATKGTCSVCGTTIFKIGAGEPAKSEAPKSESAAEAPAKKATAKK